MSYWCIIGKASDSLLFSHLVLSIEDIVSLHSALYKRGGDSGMVDPITYRNVNWV